jgi:hypothetical protein
MLEILHRPISVGDTILCKDYYSTSYSLHVVKRLTSKAIIISVQKRHWDPITRTSFYRSHELRRNPSDVAVVTTQLELNKSQYPENFL